VPEDRLDLIRRVLAPAGVKPPRREAQLTVAILQLVASRRGLAALPAWAVAQYLERGYIVARPIGKHGLWAELYAAVRETDAARAFVADFIDTVKRDSFARLPGIALTSLPKIDLARLVLVIVAGAICRLSITSLDNPKQCKKSVQGT